MTAGSLRPRQVAHEHRRSSRLKGQFPLPIRDLQAAAERGLSMRAGREHLGAARPKRGFADRTIGNAAPQRQIRRAPSSSGEPSASICTVTWSMPNASFIVARTAFSTRGASAWSVTITCPLMASRPDVTVQTCRS